MTPTLQDSERFLLNRWIYYLRPPHPGEIVVFRDPVDHGLVVKRIIASFGDAVEFRNGSVYLNGQKLQEAYLSPGTPTFPYLGNKEQCFKCGRGQYLVLGDNRQNSADSRTYGLIEGKDVLGLIVH